jgi:hypothetical protein
MFSADSTLRFSIERGFSESYYILCPICWNAGIKIIRWEDKTEEEIDCAICRRRDGMIHEPRAREKPEK